ncbi:PREDICTED: uncharacterized protein LOC109332507 [Lupinus angustifolius]|uniref:uncharacterized protein LOC109332507 n=1 Tax=Lupinus angustifolius TaxID=3871 RepID=UPI00092F327E|nr:PREDICTED: uncharacterized protein LOC109332507 [Lupinus angustifolius]
MKFLSSREIGAENVSICIDSQVVVSQITGASQTKDVLLGKYLAKVKELMAKFETTAIKHVPWEQNVRVNILSKLASIKSPSNNRSVVQGLHIKQHSTLLEHPQTNGQVEAANKVLMQGIKRRLQEAKGAWPEQLHHVLWAYRTTPHSTTGESPFNLTYGAEAMIPVEIGDPT